jgi:UDP-N-acetylmuramoyl-tripeptide--D-alanyl-D-alanine ligase
MIFEADDIARVLEPSSTKVIRCGITEYDTAFFDSRRVMPGGIFIALDGESTNGVAYVSDAITNGAQCVIADEQYIEQLAELAEDVSCDFYFVDNALAAFAEIGKLARRQLICPVIGIIGSVGKTTTKNMLQALAGPRAYSSRESFNNETGVPLTLCEMPANTTCAIVELGESHFGDLDYVTSIAQPDILVITNVEEAHTEFLGSIEGVAKTMNESVRLIPETGFIVLPSTISYPEILLRGNVAQVKIVHDATNVSEPIADDPYLTITNVKERDDVTHDVTVEIESRSIAFHVPLVGRHFAINAALAMAAVALAGNDITAIAGRLEEVVPQGHRMRIIQTDSLTIIDDCYNGNPASMRASIDALVDLAAKKNARSVFILGQMGELESSAQAHCDVANYAAMRSVDVLVCVGEATEYAMNNCAHPNKFYFVSVDDCLHELTAIIHKGDIVGVKASRGPIAHRPRLLPVVELLENATIEETDSPT